MADNRRVGRPNNNPGRMEPRSVPVQHDKARINDQRKVKPQAAGQPPLGVRPSHPGAQKEPKAPPDKLAGEYIQAREVPMKTMTEAGGVRIVYNKLLGGWYVVRGPHQTPLSGKFSSKAEAQASLNRKKPNVSESETEDLAEWNPFERFFKAKQPSYIPGESIAYQISQDGIDLFLLRDGRQIAHKRVDSRQALDSKLQQAQAEYEKIRQQRRMISINPRKLATQAAWDFAAEHGVRPMKIGELGKDIPARSIRGPDAEPEANPATGPEAPTRGPEAPTRIVPQMKPKMTPSSAGWGHRGETMPNMRREWERRGGGPKPAMTAEPAAEPASAGAPDVDLDRKKQILAQGNPQKYTPQILQRMHPHQISQAYQNMVSGGRSATEYGTAMRRRKMDPTVPMAAESVQEGYPDTSYERCEPAHQSRIGDLGWKGRAKQPNPPALNQNFIQARDINVEKVTEIAEREIDEMITRTMRRLGLSEDLNQGPEVDHVSLPAAWASALINDDFSGLEDEEADQCKMMMHKLATEGWHVVDVARNESGEGHDPRFTWNYQVHNPHSQYRGGEVLDYVVHKQRPAQRIHGTEPGARQFDPTTQLESTQPKLPRARARWV